MYANGQILAQHTGGYTTDRYFYLHDRLGSVRQVIGTDGAVAAHYTYKPFGEILDAYATVDNSFMFTGQYYDTEIAQYYLRARMYDPQLMRFTGRDPVRGRFTEPMTLHAYLYCLNDPVNRTDPSGKISAVFIVVGGIIGGVTSAIDSGLDEWSDTWTILRGIGTGMFGGMMPSTFFGIVGGMGLPIANSAFSSWVEGETMQEWGERTFFDSAGGGTGLVCGVGGGGGEAAE